MVSMIEIKNTIVYFFNDLKTIGIFVNYSFSDEDLSNNLNILAKNEIPSITNFFNLDLSTILSEVDKINELNIMSHLLKIKDMYYTYLNTEPEITPKMTNLLEIKQLCDKKNIGNIMDILPSISNKLFDIEKVKKDSSMGKDLNILDKIVEVTEFIENSGNIFEEWLKKYDKEINELGENYSEELVFNLLQNMIKDPETKGVLGKLLKYVLPIMKNLKNNLNK